MRLAEKRRDTLIHIAYFSVVAFIFYIFMEYLLGLVAPFVIAFIFSLILQKPIRFISKKTHIKKGFIGAVMVVLVLCSVISLLFFIGYKLFVELKDFAGYLMTRFNSLPDTLNMFRVWAVDFLGFLPDKLEKSAVEAVNNFLTNLIDRVEVEGIAAIGESTGLSSEEGFDVSMLSAPLGGIWKTIKGIPAFLASVLIGIIACFFITCDYDNIVSMVKRNVSEKQETAIVKTKHILGDIIGKMAKSYTTIVFITFCEVAIGLNILALFNIYENGYIIAISVCTAILDILPVFGTGTVLIPWAVYNLFTGNIAMAIGLLILYAVITVVRQIIEPRLVAMNVGIHPILTLFGMYVGLQLFGVLGMFVLPISFVLIKVLNEEGIIHLYGRKNIEDETDNIDEEKEENEAEKSDVPSEEAKTDTVKTNN